MVKSSNLIVFAASAANEVSSAYKVKRHGLFTYFFLKGLQGKADSNGDRIVTYREQHDYVRDKVETEARIVARDQTPQLIAAPEVMENRIDHTLVEFKR